VAPTADCARYDRLRPSSSSSAAAAAATAEEAERAAA
jgi:hypothetical protein